MNYEQKYKNALERARELMTNQNPPAFDKHLIGLVFPELNESEDKDEMIRQCLIEHIKCNKDLNWSLFQWFKPDTIIAWLEKQKGKEDIPIDCTIETKQPKYIDADEVFKWIVTNKWLKTNLSHYGTAMLADKFKEDFEI